MSYIPEQSGVSVNGSRNGGTPGAQQALLDGLAALWAETEGDPAITVAVLDGPVDTAHPCFGGTRLTALPTLVDGAPTAGFATAHGTHVASVLFGQPGSPVQGIAPGCHGVLLPVYADSRDGQAISCSQVDLARAIMQAVTAGAQVINISGGEITPSGAATPLLARAVRLCADNNILIVAAAGNEGCECLHVPAALPFVLSVGAMDEHGTPLDFSNWGPAYQAQGILAPGSAVPGAAPGGGVTVRSGTSFATPLVTGVVALLLSLQRKYGRTPDPHAVREILLETADACDPAVALNCSRFLRGRLNLVRTIHQVKADLLPRREGMPAYNANEVLPAALAAPAEAGGAACDTPAGAAPAAPAAPAVLAAPGVLPAAAPQLAARRGGVRPAQVDSDGMVFALGTLDYDFGSDARRDWFAGIFQANTQKGDPVKPPEDKKALLDYFANGLGNDSGPHDYAAAAVIWTLNLEATPIYAIQPAGPFASLVYEQLRGYLEFQIDPGANIDATRVAIPGYLEGSVALRSGQVVPLIVPELRGLYQIKCQLVTDPDNPGDAGKANDLQSRLFYELRNLGVAPQERALNAMATYSIDAVRKALVVTDKDGNIVVSYEIESVRAERTPVARPGSDCWDVVVTTFVADKVYEAAKKIFRQTVDVSDVVPVLLGQPRSYSTM